MSDVDFWLLRGPSPPCSTFFGPNGHIAFGSQLHGNNEEPQQATMSVAAGTVNVSSKESVLTPLSASLYSPSASISTKLGELQFGKLGIYGRQQETTELRQAVDRLLVGVSKSPRDRHLSLVADVGDDVSEEEKAAEAEPAPSYAVPTKQKEFILVSGYSGTGKSALVLSSIGKMIKEENVGGTFAVGKFDQCLGDNQQAPFSAIAMICQVLAQEIVRLKMNSANEQCSVFEQLKDTIMMELGTELIDLIQVFPSLDIIVSTMGNTSIHDNENPMNDSFNDHGDSSQRREMNRAGATINSESTRHRFIYAFTILLRIISSFLTPLVLVLDDLQWADAASLALLEQLLSDHENNTLMIVGIYRSNEVDDTHIFSKTLRDICTSASEKNIRITEMEIGNLDVGAVQEMLQVLLLVDSGEQGQRQLEVNQLAEICHRKTRGNVFYLIHFVSMLYNDRLLSYDGHLMEWKWNINGIEQATHATDNVVDILKLEMSNLSSQNQHILQFAAYLGSVFDERLIYALWKDFQKQLLQAGDRTNAKGIEQNSSDYTEQTLTHNDGTVIVDKEKIRKGMKEGLRSCVSAGFLGYFREQKRYRWVHDKLQEAAMDMVPAKDHRVFSQYVADVLYSKLTDRELEASIFVVVSRYNEGVTPQDPHKRLTLAKLNLRAANKAVSYSAYESVSIYCEHGIKVLPKDCWEKHYKLSLDLYSLGADAEGFLAKVHRMETYCNEVLRQKERKNSSSSSSKSLSSSTLLSTSTARVRDKLRVYTVLMNSIQNRNLSKQATDLCLDVLRQYGTRFPTNAADKVVRIVYNIGKIKSGAKYRTEEEARNLQRMENPILVEQMGLFDKLSTYLYFVDKNLLPLVIFKSLNWTLQNGYCKDSPAAFAFVSLVLAAVLGDVNGGMMYAKYALILLEKLDPVEAKQAESRTVCTIYNNVFHWKQPLRRLIKPLLRSYEAGMQSGDTESAMFSVISFITVSLVAGKTLSLIEADCRIYIMQMKKLKTSVALNIAKVVWQFVLNLMGRSQFKTRLTGEALKEDVCRKEGEEDAYTIANLNMYKIMLLSFFGFHEDGAKLALEVGDSMQKANPGPPYVIYDLFHRCLCMIITARKLKQKKSPIDSSPKSRRFVGWGMEAKCLKASKLGLAKIKGWIEQGNPNVRHYESLLEAEVAAYEGKPYLAKKNYETAVTISSQAGFLQDSALANERYSEYLLDLEGFTVSETNVGGGSGGFCSRPTKDHGENMQEAIFRLQESIDLYREWGALAKVESLEQKHSVTLLAGVPSHIEVH